MTIDVDHLLAVGVVVRVGSADLWAVTRRLLSAGVRIGTEEQLARHGTTRSVRVGYSDNPPDGEGS